MTGVQTCALPIWLKADGLAQIHGFQPGRQILRHKGKRFSCALVVELRHVDEPVLELADNVVSRHVMLRKNHHACAFLKRRHRLFESCNDFGIVVHADGVGVGENQLGQGRDDVGQQLVKPADGLGFSDQKS